VLAFPKDRLGDDTEWGSSGRDARYLRKLRRLLARMDEQDRRLLLFFTQKMTRTP
jgi:hypothetical protein